MPHPARCTYAAAHLQSIAYTPYAMNIHDQQAAARSRYDYSVVHINYAVT